jgi:exosortase H (IPTLxxWG-CTERM-specific)
MKARELWNRPDARFIILFLAILGITFTVIALRPVNDSVVVPYTAFVARVSGVVLRIFGESATVAGCLVSSPRFAVTIYNGCNGLITSLIFMAGVVAFPARPAAKLIGVAGGLLAIQIINMVRIVSLFYIGIYFPDLFNDAHIFFWQSVVILSGVALWVIWASRVALREKVLS